MQVKLLVDSLLKVTFFSIENNNIGLLSVMKKNLTKKTNFALIFSVENK